MHVNTLTCVIKTHSWIVTYSTVRDDSNILFCVFKN